MKRARLLLLAATAACSATPPANWATGGATLDIPRARWVYGDTVVDVIEDGRILVNGYQEFTVDAAGRLFDLDHEPVALLEADGLVSAPDDEVLGIVGSEHASRPDEDHAWLSLTPSGEVIRYDEDGERYGFGVWMGCRVSPRASQLCVYLTHVLGKSLMYRPRPGVSVGIGVGVGVPIR
jgi:hypothetical protein